MLVTEVVREVLGGYTCAPPPLPMRKPLTALEIAHITRESMLHRIACFTPPTIDQIRRDTLTALGCDPDAGVTRESARPGAPSQDELKRQMLAALD